MALDDTSKTDATPAPATETAAQSAPAAPTTPAATGATGGEVKVVVEQKAPPTRAEVEAKAEADKRAAQDAAFDRATKRAEAEARERAGGTVETAKTEPTRGPDGKFSSPTGKVAETKEGQPQEKAPVAPVADKAKDAKGQAAPTGKGEQTQNAAAHAMPQSWPKAMGEHWATLPADVQKYHVERDKDVARTITRYGQALKTHEPLVKAVAEHRDTLRGWGMSADKAFTNLMQTAIDLDRDPIAGLQGLAKAYGVNLAQFALSQLDPSDLPADPRIGEYQTKIAALNRQIAQMENARKAERSERETEAAAAAEQNRGAAFEQSFHAANDSMQEFAKERPDFARLQPAIAKLIGPVMDANPDMTPGEALSEAYDIAKARDPQARQQAIKAEAAALDKRRADELHKQAEAARAANAINVQGAPMSAGAMSMRQTLDAAFDRGMRIHAARNG